jgi:hypothetical protein
MHSGQRLRWEVAREVERARQNIEDIHAIEKEVWLNVVKSRVLRAEAARMDRFYWSIKRSVRLSQPDAEPLSAQPNSML